MFVCFVQPCLQYYFIRPYGSTPIVNETSYFIPTVKTILSTELGDSVEFAQSDISHYYILVGRNEEGLDKFSFLNGIIKADGLAVDLTQDEPFANEDAFELEIENFFIFLINDAWPTDLRLLEQTDIDIFGSKCPHSLSLKERWVRKNCT